jgi:hypothetical protein
VGNITARPGSALGRNSPGAAARLCFASSPATCSAPSRKLPPRRRPHKLPASCVQVLPCAHSSPALKKCRRDFLRTRALAVYAWARAHARLRRCPAEHAPPRRVRRLRGRSPGAGRHLTTGSTGSQTAARALLLLGRGSGSRDALAWLRSRGCPWGYTHTVCFDMAARGAPRVLQYARWHARRTAAGGTATLQEAVRVEGTSSCCGTRTSTAARCRRALSFTVTLVQ